MKGGVGVMRGGARVVSVEGDVGGRLVRGGVGVVEGVGVGQVVRGGVGVGVVEGVGGVEVGMGVVRRRVVRSRRCGSSGKFV